MDTEKLNKILGTRQINLLADKIIEKYGKDILYTKEQAADGIIKILEDWLEKHRRALEETVSIEKIPSDDIYIWVQGVGSCYISPKPESLINLITYSKGLPGLIEKLKPEISVHLKKINDYQGWENRLRREIRKVLSQKDYTFLDLLLYFPDLWVLCRNKTGLTKEEEIYRNNFLKNPDIIQGETELKRARKEEFSVEKSKIADKIHSDLRKSTERVVKKIFELENIPEYIKELITELPGCFGTVHGVTFIDGDKTNYVSLKEKLSIPYSNVRETETILVEPKRGQINIKIGELKSLIGDYSSDLLEKLDMIGKRDDLCGEISHEIGKKEKWEEFTTETQTNLLNYREFIKSSLEELEKQIKY